MSPRDTRVVVLAQPTEQEARAWCFEHYATWLPLAGEIVFFNRSWYNHPGVERVMGCCTRNEVTDLLASAPVFEELLVHCGFERARYYPDVSQSEQKLRLKDRYDNPLKHWKRSPVDDKALDLWDAYSKARNEMRTGTDRPLAPWMIVKADDTTAARLALMQGMLRQLGRKDQACKSSGGIKRSVPFRGGADQTAQS